MHAKMRNSLPCNGAVFDDDICAVHAKTFKNRRTHFVCDDERMTNHEIRHLFNNRMMFFCKQKDMTGSRWLQMHQRDNFVICINGFTIKLSLHDGTKFTVGHVKNHPNERLDKTMC